jgi:ribonuclease-3
MGLPRSHRSKRAPRLPVEDRLGYRFNSPDLLRQALVHRSYLNENPGFDLPDNERLEFLGDVVLSLIVAETLYRRFPDLPEGKLTRLRAWLVRTETLARWAKEVDLGSELLLSRGEDQTGGRDRPSILASAFEAVLGAVYLDGGLDAARKVLLPFIERELEKLRDADQVLDPKTWLQEVTQARWKLTPVYVTVHHTGPSHRRRFTVEVRLGDRVLATGEGYSKRAAEQDAARKALASLEAGSP